MICGDDAGYGTAAIPHDAQGVFISRPNRFLSLVNIDGSEEKVHVHDPGRLTELLYPGNTVLVRRVEKEGRATSWDVIAAAFEEQWVLVHSGYHRSISEMVLNDPEISPLGEVVDLKPEITVGHSRLDFVLTSDGVMTGVEVKGCTLARGGVALFPDAPTLRGTKHLETLLDMKNQGMRAVLLVLVLRTDVQTFAPNADTDPLFAEMFWKAVDAGVEVKPLVFRYDGQRVIYLGAIPVSPHRSI